MTGSVIAALRVTLGLDSAEFDRNSARVDRSARQLNSNLDGMRSSITRLGAAMAGFVVGSLTVAAGGIAKLGLDAINAADEVSKAAQSIGIGTEELSRLRYAADLSGIAFDELQANLGRLNRGMLDAAAGTGTAKDAFDRLGITVRNNDGSLKTSTQVLQELADRFQAMPDGVTKSALAMEIFGRRGAAMIPLLNSGAQGIAELSAEASRFGLVITEDAGRRAEEFNDNLDRMKGAFAAVSGQIAYDMLPQMVQLQNWLLANRELLRQLGQVAVYVASEVGRTFASLAREFQYYAGLIQSFRDGLQARGIDTGLRYGLPSAQTMNPLIEAANNVTAAMGRAGGAMAEFPALAGQAGAGASSLARAVGSADSALARMNDTAASLQQLLARLFPDMAQANRIAEDMATLERALAERLIDPMRFRQAHGMLAAERGTLEAGAPSPVQVRDPNEPLVIPVLPDLATNAPEVITRLQQNFRLAFSDGLYAALNGNLKSFFRSWMADTASRGLEEALNGLADSLYGLIAGLFGGKSGSGGLSSLVAGIGGLFGGGGKSIPKFANGGAMRLGGLAGVDRNLLSLNGAPLARVSAGEVLRVSPANDRGGAPSVVNNYYTLPSNEFWAQVDGRAAAIAPGIMKASSDMAIARIDRRNSRRLA